MAMAKLKNLEPETYHGVPVLHLRVDDPIPSPRAPERYAVRVYPDLARYLLTLNWDRNRKPREGRAKLYASDMAAGLWMFSPEALVFSGEGVLLNGQHRLLGVIEYGSDVWMMCDFGWSPDIVYAFDRAAARSNVDSFRGADVPNPANIASTIAYVRRYEAVVGSARLYQGIGAPTSQAALAIYHADPDGWGEAVHAGMRVYRALDRALAPSLWAGAYRVIEAARPGEAGPFFDAIAEGTDRPKSASRLLADYYRRRPVTLRRTADSREPFENIIRAFNAHRAGRTFSWVTQAGFVLSRVK